MQNYSPINLLSSVKNVNKFENKPANKSLNFTGYIGCPLKDLYLQPDYAPQNLEFAREIKKIGVKELFNVIIQIGNKIFKDPEDVLKEIPEAKYQIPTNTSRWSQDNKLVLEDRENHKDEIAADSVIRHNNDASAVKQLAKATNSPYRKLESVVEGGNSFIGKTDKGEPFALLGQDALYLTGTKLACSEAGVEIRDFLDLENQDTFFIRPRLRKAHKHFQDNKEQYLEKAKNLIAKDLRIKPENLHFISQPNFHIDMEIRPLNYPYILVNDYDYSIQLLEKMYQNTSDKSDKKHLKKLINNTKYHKTEMATQYTSVNNVAEELEKKGFKVIRVPGVFNTGETNFMNAIVHQRPNGDLVYITNKSCWHDMYKGGSDLNKLFQKTLKEKVPSIKQVYFVAGPQQYNKSNFTSMCLGQLKGGTHCMTSEHPDFQRWNNKE